MASRGLKIIVCSFDGRQLQRRAMINAPAVPGKDASLGKVLTGTNPGDELRPAACSRQFDRFLRRPDGPGKVVCRHIDMGQRFRGLRVVVLKTVAHVKHLPGRGSHPGQSAIELDEIAIDEQSSLVARPSRNSARLERASSNGT